MSSSKPPAPVQSPPASSLFSPPFGRSGGLSNGYSGFSSSRPKSPKSSKGTILENPLLKPSHQVAPSFGGGLNSPAVPVVPSFLQQQQLARGPLTPLPSNLMDRQQQFQTQTSVTTPQGFASPKSIMKKRSVETPGPPPKASLSLMGGIILPTEMKATTPARKESESKHEPITPLVETRVSHLTSPNLLLDESENKRASYGNSSSALGFPYISSDADRWVVAYGYTSLSDYNELFDVLSSFGTLQQHQSSGNWLAVQYESQLSTERALCSQPLILGNTTLCGTVRGTPALLQRLRSGMDKDNSTTGTAALRPVRQLAPSSTSGRTLAEDDFLLLNDDDGKQSNGRPRPPTSICQKVLSWYFGWDVIQNEDNDGGDHPHSD